MLKDKDKATMTEEGKLLVDSLTATMKIARYAYEAATEAGFTPAQALELTKMLMSQMLNLGGKK